MKNSVELWINRVYKRGVNTVDEAQTKGYHFHRAAIKTFETGFSSQTIGLYKGEIWLAIACPVDGFNG